MPSNDKWSVPEGYVACRVMTIMDDHLSDDLTLHVAYLCDLYSPAQYLTVLEDLDAAYAEAQALQGQPVGVRKDVLVSLNFIHELDEQETTAPAIEMMPF